MIVNDTYYQIIDILLDTPTSDDIQSLLLKLKKEDGYSYSTIKKVYDCLNAALLHATIKKDISENPMLLVKMLAKSEFETKEIRYFSKEECALIIEECSRQYNTGKPIYQYADAYILMLNTGIRLGEAIGLKKTDWNNMSVDCDCCAVAEDPCIADIGILASTDPIAIDQACIDLVYACSDPGKPHLLERIESRNGVHTIEAASALGYGTRAYDLIEVE